MSSSTQRIADENYHISSAIRTLLEPHSIFIPDNSKVIRLGIVDTQKARPIKLLCGSKKSASKLVADFKASVKNDVEFPTGFRIVNDKTLFQRNPLRSCHAELESRKRNGETNLEILYVNGAPQVRIFKSKNFGLRHHADHC